MIPNPNFTKRIKHLLFVAAIVVCNLISVNAQVDFNIGSGTSGNLGTTYPCPLQDYFEGSRAQYLYKANELSLAGLFTGNISSIKFNVTNLNNFSGEIAELKIKISSSNVSELNISSWESINTNSNYGPIDYTPTLGINTFTFSSPFYWDGTSNIIIEICNGKPNTTIDDWSENVTIPWTTGLLFNASHTYFEDDLGSLCDSTNTSTNFSSTTRPNITFSLDLPNCTGTPLTGTVTANTVLACSKQPIILSAINTTSASGIQFKWQDSTMTSNWDTVPNASILTLSVKQNQTTWYRLKSTCINSGQSAFSNVVKIFSYTPLGTGSFSACANQVPYYYGGKKIDTAGTYKLNLFNQYGCDSIAIATFSLVNTGDTTVFKDTICYTQMPYTKYGLTFNTYGTFYQKLFDGNAAYFYNSDTATLNNKLNYLYKQMYAFGSGGYNGHDNFGQKAYDITSDLMGNDMVIHSQGYGWFNRDYQYINTQLATDNVRPNVARRRFYDMLYTIKGILEAIDATTNYSTTDKEKIKGQCYGLRAYCYYYLINYFQQTYYGNTTLRGLPIIKENIAASNNYGTVQDIYNLMIADLTQAETLLTGKTFTDKTIFSLSVVYGFRARIALLMNNWASAAFYANAALTNMGANTLMSPSEYKQGFSQISNPEWMWGSLISTENATIYATFFSHFDSKSSGYASLESQKKITKYLYDKIPVGDVRKTLFQQAAPLSGGGSIYTDAITGYLTPTTNSVVYNQLKFRVTSGSWAADYVYMRTAEMYLIEAEARARIGDNVGSRNVLETLIKSRNPAYSAATFSDSTLINEILLQRRIELWGEGFSLIDLKRTNAGLNRVIGSGNHGTPNYNPIVDTLPPGSPLFVWVTPTKDSGLIIPCEKIEKLVLTSRPSFSGNIIHPTKGKINSVVINNNGLTSNFNGGKYSYDCIYTSVNIKPTKNNDITKANGINATDVLFTQRHILNTTKLNSAYKLIAADVNGDKQINATDILRIKRLILGTDTTFTSATKGNRLWEFVDSAYQFPDTTNPFPFKDSISFTNLTSNKINQTFIGVKLGDVNYDWNPLVAKGVEVKPVELVYTISNEQLAMSNSVVRIPITVKNFKDIVAIQYTLHFDHTKYEFVGIENNHLNIDFNSKQASENSNITMLWTDKNAVEKTLEDGTELFTLVLRSTVNQLPITELKLMLTNDITEIAAWDKDFYQHNIVLTKQQKSQTPNTEQWSVSPNPTSGDIKIKIESKVNKTVRFELTDVQGRTILKQSAEIQKGKNNVALNLKQNSNIATGIYFLKAIGLEGENVIRIMVK